MNFINKNFYANIITYIITLSINMLLTPYVTKNLGTEAFGFISFANTIVNYISLITIALNSMASRFVAVSYYKGDIEEAKKYYTSVYYGNLIISTIIIIPCIIFMYFIERVINVPKNLVIDLKLLIGVLLINFIVSLNANLLSIAMFVKNRLFLISISNVITALLKGVLLLILFSLFKPRIYIIGIVTLAMTIFTFIWNRAISKRLLPEVYINKKYFDNKVISTITKSGIWNSIIRLGNMLLEGVDLLIANLFIGSIDMGVLAISKTIPNIISSFVFSLSNIYLPDLTKAYAQNDPQMIKNVLNRSISILGLFANIPLVLLFTLSDILYKLWLPAQNASQLRILSMIAVLGFVINGSISTVYCGFSIANELKTQSIVVVVSGIINTVIVIFLLKFTSLGLYAIAGVSSIVSIIRDLVFGLPFASVKLKQKWYSFYPSVIKNILVFIIDTVFVYIIRYRIFKFQEYSWLRLTVLGIVATIVCILINYIFLSLKKLKSKCLYI